jgi:DNA (cytosine-5)-methyltransferase 1
MVVAHSLTAEGFDASEDGTGRGPPLVAYPILEVDGGGTTRGAAPNGVGIGASGDPMFTLQAGKQHAVAFSCKDHGGDALDGLAPTLRAMGHDGSHANAGGQVAVAFAETISTQSPGLGGGAGHQYRQKGNETSLVGQAAAVRRLMPVECERLMGLPDDWTLIPWRGGLAADGPRYKAIGNGMAVNVVRWIGRRIEAVEAVTAVQLLAAE